MSFSDRFDCWILGHDWKDYDQHLRFCDRCDRFEKKYGDGYEGQRMMDAVWLTMAIVFVGAAVVSILYCVANGGY